MPDSSPLAFCMPMQWCSAPHIRPAQQFNAADAEGALPEGTTLTATIGPDATTAGSVGQVASQCVASGGGGGGPVGSCVGDVCGTITQTASSDQGTTYQLGLTLSGDAANVYTIYGDGGSSMEIPASFQEAAPFGANTGGVNPAFVDISASAGADGWLSVGLGEGDSAGVLGSVGIDFGAWTADAGLSVDNGAVFWMAPGDGPAGSVVIGQVTTSGDFTAAVNAQGRSSSGDDWQASGITFASSSPGGDGSDGIVVMINFQPPSMAIPEGYLKDSGAPYGDRGNGLSYGWSCDLESEGDVRDRNGASTRDSSMVIPDRDGSCDSDLWDISLPNGDYTVVVGYSDPSYSTATDGCTVEGLPAGVDATGVARCTNSGISCCHYPLTGVPCLRPGPRRRPRPGHRPSRRPDGEVCHVSTIASWARKYFVLHFVITGPTLQCHAHGRIADARRRVGLAGRRPLPVLRVHPYLRRRRWRRDHEPDRSVRVHPRRLRAAG